MAFRVLPVLVWSVVATTFGAAVAVLETNALNWFNFLLVMGSAALIQGYPTHLVNEIYDWKSGADQYRHLGGKSGGSKVIKAGLTDINGLWFMLVVTTIVVGVFAFYVGYAIDWKVLWFIIPGFFCGVFYTLPPFRFAYQPFAGEWLGGFAGVFLAVTGSYYVQTLRLETPVLWAALCLGIVYIGVMMLFHYLDYEGDRNAKPQKKTTIVKLGLRRSKYYVCGCVLAAFILALFCAIRFHWLFGFLALHALLHLFFHIGCDPRDSASIVTYGRLITYETILWGILFASIIEPGFLLLIIPVSFGFYSHKKFGKLPKPKQETAFEIG
ncbi:prenyltransferase [candidate division KSB1 bacterium]|nr:prenyltransferase [candidate division KSB1 bacterium]NIR73429.1 prenyltransferase [candidate division KSB1 bacterium]NIS28420.1 prenyltransferase [candidate division KSB1 bacterium]NIT75300.1 prenyltransferase [candidate division KSB1 bacterium]NIU29148.1 prenyltransferase [candidate division KSB1 bacterium]